MEDYSAANLKVRQSLPLEAKVNFARSRIIDWYERNSGDVYISFSGGKESTVLLHLVRSIYPNVPAVFANTGLEYPEIVEFVSTIENVITIRPKMSFKSVIETYGYPVISKEQAQYIGEYQTTKSADLKFTRKYGNSSGRGKISNKWFFMTTAPFKISHKCCDKLKKEPFKIYEKATKQTPYIGTMACDSGLRFQSYIKYGCNTFKTVRASSRPLSVWLEEDIWEYIKQHNLPYCSVYDKGIERTGCIFCLFGIGLTKQNAISYLKVYHPNLYEYCMSQLGMREVLDFMQIKESTL